MPVVQLRRRSRGFSITELVMAVAILAFGLGVIYDQFQKTVEPSQRYTHRVQARMLAEKQLAELCASGAASLSSYKPAAGFQKIESSEVFYSKIEIASPGQLTVHVGWDPTTEGDVLEFSVDRFITAERLCNR